MNEDEFVIEQAKEFSQELVESVERLAKQEGKNYQPLTDKDLQEMLQNPQNFLFIARHIASGEIAGMIFVMIYRIPYAKKAYFDDLVVDEKYRKRGLAKRLLEMAIETAKKYPLSYIMLTAQQTRVAGNSLYEKFGFKKRDSNVYRLYL